MIGLVLASTLRVAEQDRDYWKGCAERDRQRLFEQSARLEPLFKQLGAWVTNEAGNITPEQAAQMFYAQNDAWQAAFFNVMQDQVMAHHDSNPGGFGPGVPAGEGQWYHAMKGLNDSGFETLEAMMDHARYHREEVAS